MRGSGSPRLLLAVLALGIGSRLVLTTVFNEPFSVDVWPLVKISGRLVGNPTLRIFDDRFFDGYNNRWPGVVLYAAILSVATGLDTPVVYRYLGLAGAAAGFGTLLYTLLRSLHRDKRGCAAALLYFLTLPSLAVFSSALLKEVYSYPLLLTLLIYALRRWRRPKRDTVPVILASAGLVVSHYFVTAMALGILGSVLGAYLVSRIMGRATPSEESHLLRQIPVVLTVLALSFSTYYTLFGYPGLRYMFTPRDVATYTLYTVSVFGSYALLTRLGRGPVLKIAILSLLAALLILAVGLGVPLVPGLEVSSRTAPLYIAPAAMPLAMLVPRRSGSAGRSALRYLLSGVLLFTAVNTLFIVLSKPELSSVLHRVIGYLALANTTAILLSSSGGVVLRRASLAVAIATAVLGLTALACVATGVDDLVFSWVYREGEVEGFDYAIRYSSRDVTLCGDVKLLFYASIDRYVDTASVLKAAYTGGGIRKGSLVVLHIDNYLKGYVVGVNAYSVGGLVERLVEMDRLYSNGYVDAWLSR